MNLCDLQGVKIQLLSCRLAWCFLENRKTTLRLFACIFDFTKIHPKMPALWELKLLSLLLSTPNMQTNDALAYVSSKCIIASSFLTGLWPWTVKESIDSFLACIFSLIAWYRSYEFFRVQLALLLQFFLPFERIRLPFALFSGDN